MDKNYAYIKFTGKADVSEIADILDIEPSTFWNVGDKRRNGSIYKFSHWSYVSPEFEEKIMDDALERVVTFIEGRIENFRQVPDYFQPSIQCVGYHEEESPGFHLSDRLIERLASIWLVSRF